MFSGEIFHCENGTAELVSIRKLLWPVSISVFRSRLVWAIDLSEIPSLDEQKIVKGGHKMDRVGGSIA